jgi:hypothetical protein
LPGGEVPSPIRSLDYVPPRHEIVGHGDGHFSVLNGGE